MIGSNDFKKGMVIKVNNEPFQVVDISLVKPGKGASFAQTKLKHLISGKVLDRNFKSGEQFDEMDLEYKNAVYVYHDRNNLIFQDPKTNERISMPLETAGNRINFMKEKMPVSLMSIDEKIFDFKITPKVEMKIIEAMPATKGNTANGAMKSVKLENGYEMNVPLFIKEGDIIRINSDTGDYVERVN